MELGNVTIIIIVIIIALLIFGFAYWNRNPKESTNIVPVQSTNGKVVALLELTGNGAVQDDTAIAVSLQYIANLNNFQITIVDTQSDVSMTQNLLQQYYDMGYRVFIGFSVSTVLNAVLPWFLQHQDTVGISLLSTAIALDVNKNVIRLTPSDTFSAYFMAQFINHYGYSNVLFVSDSGDLVSENLYVAIVQQLNAGITTSNIIVNDLNVDQTSRNAVVSALNNLPPNTIMVPFLANDRAAYLQLVVDTLPISQIPPQLDTIDNEPTFTSQETIAFDGKYYFVSLSNIYSLTNQELQQILGVNFSENAYDAYNIARIASTTADKSTVYSIVDHLLSHVGSCQLNNFNDKKYSFFAIEQWIHGKWVYFWVTGNVPLLGIFESIVLETQAEV